MSFKVGQKIVCVEANGLPRDGRRLVAGRVYVVRGYGCGCSGNGGRGLMLVGLLNLSEVWICGCYGEPVYAESRFRPLDEMQEEARKRQQSEAPIRTT